MRRRLLILPILISLACESSSDLTSIPTATMTPAPTPTPSRCEPAGSAQSEAIRIGVKGVADYNDVASQAWAVRSNDFVGVWFVATEITGPGIDPGEVIGVWAMGGEKESPAGIFSVNAYALEFSDWGDGPRSDAGFSMEDDGAREVEACALASAPSP
jgi:hypothetical protein